jgi:sensor histidine kinase YesM
MDTRRYYLKQDLNRYDWLTITIYWLVAAPIIFLVNTSDTVGIPAEKAVLFILLTMLIDTLAVIVIVFYVPYFWFSGRKLLSIASLLGTVGVLGLIYMMAYRQLHYGYYVMSVTSWVGGIVQHMRSYGLLFVVTYVRKAQEDKMTLLKALKAKEREESQKLRTRVSPHFLSNSLGGMRESWMLDAGKRFYERIMDLLNYFTYSCREDYILLSDELAFLRNYLHLEAEKLPYPEILGVEISAAAADYSVTPGVMVQFLENAFKHGGKSAYDHIAVEIAVDDGCLYFTVENTIGDGQGDDFKEGIGMENAKRTLDIHYRDSYQLEVFEDNGIYRVQLVIPLKRLQNEGKNTDTNH